MYVLLLIILGALSPEDLSQREQTIKLETYSSLEDCQTAKVTITADMSASYPGDTSFRLECRPMRSKI
jgi:hypothetical protein